MASPASERNAHPAWSRRIPHGTAATMYTSCLYVLRRRGHFDRAFGTHSYGIIRPPQCGALFAMSPNVSEWLPRALVESVLIVVSILLALALDEWREDQEIQELIDRSIINFVNEVTQNRSRIVDVRAYHHGVQQILKQRSANGGLESKIHRSMT